MPNSEAIEAQNKSRNRGSKRSHHGPSDKGNGNYNNDSNPDANPDAFAQLKDRARSPGSQILSSTMASPNGEALQNSVLKTLPHQATQLAHQAPQIRELNNEFLLAYNSLIPNSEFARVHQQMIQERRQQQQLAREEAAKLKERVETALAEARAFRTSESESADFSEVRVRKFRTLKTPFRTRT
jgi:hypothetical protein